MRNCENYAKRLRRFAELGRELNDPELQNCKNRRTATTALTTFSEPHYQIPSRSQDYTLFYDIQILQILLKNRKCILFKQQEILKAFLAGEGNIKMFPVGIPPNHQIRNIPCN